MMKWLNTEGNKSLRPRKSFQKDSKRDTLYRLAKQSLGASDTFFEAVKLPKGENLNEWLAVHIVDFYNNINLLIGPIENELQNSSETMKAGEWEYLYKDESSSDYKKPKQLNAFEYVTLTIDLLEDKINDPSIFPTDEGVKYPKNYRKIVKDIFKRMFRILAFLICEKYRLFDKKGMIAHLNTIVKHYLCFTFQHSLLGKKELVPLSDWIKTNLPKHYEKIQKKKDKK